MKMIAMLLSLLVAFSTAAQIGFSDQGMLSVVPNGLMHYWPLDSVVQGQSPDVVGGLRSVVTNNPVLMRGLVKGGLRCTDSGVDVTNITDSFRGDFTIACWVKIVTTNNPYEAFVVAAKSDGSYNMWLSCSYNVTVDGYVGLSIECANQNPSFHNIVPRLMAATNLWMFCVMGLSNGTMCAYYGDSGTLNYCGGRCESQNMKP